MDIQPQNPNQEVDLFYVKNKLKGYITQVNDSFFDAILFIKRNIIILIVLLVGGYWLGNYQDSSTKAYNHKIIAIPNFNSVDYLYGEIERINLKIGDKDSVFLNSIGLKHYRNVAGIKIEPIVDIYEFIDDSKSNQETDRKFELFKLLSESGEMDKMLEDKPTSKNYKNHLITISTVGQAANRDVVESLFAYLNAEPYFKAVQQQYKISLDQTMIANDSTIKQIDNVMNNFSAAGSSSNITYYNDNRPLHEILRIKEQLLKEQEINRVKKINYEKIVKEASVQLNVRDDEGLHGKMKFIIPVLFILLFLCIAKFINFYKKQSAKRKAVIVNP
jgi:lipopolysaccharide export system protein LptC